MPRREEVEMLLCCWCCLSWWETEVGRMTWVLLVFDSDVDDEADMNTLGLH